MKKAKYLSIMATIVLIMVLLSVSFAWYAAGNASVTAENLTLTAAAPNTSPLNFLYDADSDVELDKLYINQTNHIADQYGRKIYTGEEGHDDSTLSAGKLADNDYRYTLYYVVELTNDSDSEVTATLELHSNTIYKMKDASGNKWDDIDIGGTKYTVSGTDIKQSGTTVGSIAEGSEEYKDGIVTIDSGSNAGTYYLISGIVYRRTEGDAFDITKLERKGYYGEKITGDTSNYKFFVCEYDESAQEPTATIESYTRDEEHDTITVSGGDTATGKQFLIGIRYQAADNTFEYCTTDYMGAYFNFEIKLTSNTPA